MYALRSTSRISSAQRAESRSLLQIETRGQEPVTSRSTHKSDHQTLHDIPVHGPVDGINLCSFLSVSRKTSTILERTAPVFDACCWGSRIPCEQHQCLTLVAGGM